MTVIQVAPGTTRIGWIGTGVMGRSMCGHLLAAGFAGPVVLETLHDSQMTSIARLKTLLQELRGGTR